MRRSKPFLKVIYEQFYKVYNPKAADRLGVVYTPNEIVNFMIEGADWLCEQHFGKNLIDRDVEILDPATGTGTFICALLEHFRGQPDKLAQKYKEELHANEVAILPYYVANLNIEATYAAITGQFAEYPNLCFVDTLDNTAGLGIRAGHQHEMFGAMSDENVSRIKRQNARKISVIIGNPPYNANQQNENDNNKNRTYKRIDEVIKSTYIRQSTAQKTKLYDMYARFYRWASDRMSGEGILAFITNRSFIDSRTFDGFRKCVAEEFAEIYIMDLGGDVRANPKLSGTKHNVFGIQTGVAIAFLIKKGGDSAASSLRANAKQSSLDSQKEESGLPRGLQPLAMTGQSPARIHYARRPEAETAEDKRAFLAATPMRAIPFTRIKPDAKGNWLGQTENDWDSLIPIADKKTKAAKVAGQDQAIFKDFYSGIKTNRDEWVYDFDHRNLTEKSRFLIEHFLSQKSGEPFDMSIKWSRDLKAKLARRDKLNLQRKYTDSVWRPFVKKSFLWVQSLCDIFYTDHIYAFGQDGTKKTPFLTISGTSSAKPFQVFCGEIAQDYEAIEKSNILPRYRYTPSGERVDNITDWALAQFVAHYGAAPPSLRANAKQSSLMDGRIKSGHDKEGEAGLPRGLQPLAMTAEPLTKDAIFHYVYAVLHNPAYREKYALNLKRDFPRIPFYPDFWRWAAWGEALMALHIGYESVDPWPITRLDVPDERARAGGVAPKPILKAEREAGIIRIDSETTLSGIPPVAFTYLLGNRSGLEWILDQYKEKTPKDPTIREKFNTYRFADYKEKVIDLLARVTRVSVETMAIVGKMRDEMEV
jgi:predicted helicase